MFERPKSKSKLSSPATPAQPTVAPPRPLKANEQKWTRNYSGRRGELNFQLRLERTGSGHLHARYQVSPGRGSGWHLEGQLRDDNTFVLVGTENEAFFEGVLSPSGPLTVTRFQNKDFKLENLVLGQTLAPPVQVKPRPTPQPAPLPAEQHETPGQSGTTAGQLQSASSQPIKRFALKEEDVGFINDLNFSPKSQSRKDRHQVFFNIVSAYRRLGAAFPEIVAAQWALESGWGKSQSGKNNLFGIKEFDPNKPRTLVKTKEWSAAAGRNVEAVEPFADYADYLDGLIARLNFTITNPRYAKAGYFEAKSLRLAAVSLERAGYATDREGGGYGAKLVAMMQGCGVDVDQPLAQAAATPSIAPAPTPAHSPSLSTPATLATTPATAPQSSQHQSTQGKADELDVLLGLNVYTEHYTVEQIKQAREIIAKLHDGKLKGDLFEKLQAKVSYHNQRNNEALGLQSDRWKLGNGHWVIYTGKPIGDIMCNLTSLAMVLETLGIDSPKDDMQLEDYLEQVRRDQGLAPRTTASGWTAVAAELEAKKVAHLYNFKGGHADWGREVLPHLKAGRGVMMSLNGHIIRLQGVSSRGITVDDPYGKLPSLLAFNPRSVTRSYNGALNKKDSEDGIGEDNVYPWSQVSQFSFLWIAAFDRK